MRAIQRPRRRRSLRHLAWLIPLWLAASPAAGLTLEEAIALSLANNERVKAADEGSRAAGARVAKARSFLLPDLTLEGDYIRRSHETRRTVDGSTSTLQTRDGREARATVEQTIFDAQAWPLLSQARKAHDAARHQALDEKRKVAFETARAFLNALGLERVVQAAAERLDLAQRNLDEIQVRFDAQLVGSNDVTRAELEVASAERELVGVRGTAQISRLMLGYLLDVEIADSLAVPRELLEQAVRTVEPVAIAVPEATERRPDIQAERSRAAALGSAAREPLARYAPDLDFTGTAWTTNESGFSGRDHDWTLGLGLTWDVFDGGEREADRSERAALARESEFNLEGLERGVDVDIETARVALESQQVSLVRAERAVTAARRNASETTELYRQGLVRALEVVDANVQLFEAEVERTGVQYALALAFLDLRAAVGLDPLGNEGQP